MILNSYSFLTFGETQESTDSQEFKRYIGVGSSFVVAVNPGKDELEKIYGREMQEQEYVVDGPNGKEARIHFIVRTDPKVCNDIEITSKLMFTLRNAPAYNRDETKVQVIDGYGNTKWAAVEDAREGKKLLSADGKPMPIDDKYRMCCVGEADLVSFLKTYLRIPSSFEYVNGTWAKKKDASKGEFKLDFIKNYFSGDFSELKDALALQPNNKVKLLYGVKTSEENKQYQAVASKEGLILSNSAGASAYAKAEQRLQEMKRLGSYPTTEFKVQELQEYSVQPTNLSIPKEPAMEDPFGSTGDLPWA